MSDLRILITGATGFMGRHLAAVCASAGTVVGLGRGVAPSSELPADVEYRHVDLLREHDVAELVAELEPQRVFHLAAHASVARSWDEPVATIEENMAMTRTLLDACAAAAPDSAVLIAGSGEEYGPVPPDRMPIVEAEPLRPQNPYALSKAATGLLAGFYADARKMRVVYARSFNQAGPGQSDAYVASAFARQIAAAEASDESGEVSIATGDLRPSRDFVDVRDAARAYWLLLDHVAEGAPPGSYNVCSGESVTVADILAGLARHTPLEVTQRTDPDLLRENEVMDIRGSHEKLTRLTGWQPEIPLDQTLRDTLGAWREQLRMERADG